MACLAEVLSHHPLAISLHQMSLAKHAGVAEDRSRNPGDSRLSGSWRANECHVVARGSHRQPSASPLLGYPCQSHYASDCPLDVFEAHEAA